MTTAERQARYRVRLKQRASFEGLPARVRDAVDEAIAALWEYHLREPNDGSFDDYDTIEQFRTGLETAKPGNGDLLSYCREFLRIADGLPTEEAKALSLVVEIADALSCQRSVERQGC